MVKIFCNLMVIFFLIFIVLLVLLSIGLRIFYIKVDIILNKYKLEDNIFERIYIIKNKKKFIVDIILVLLVVEEKNMNNLIVDNSISKVKVER